MSTTDDVLSRWLSDPQSGAPDVSDPLFVAEVLSRIECRKTMLNGLTLVGGSIGAAVVIWAVSPSLASTLRPYDVAAPALTTVLSLLYAFRQARMV